MSCDSTRSIETFAAQVPSVIMLNRRDRRENFTNHTKTLLGGVGMDELGRSVKGISVNFEQALARMKSKSSGSQSLKETYEYKLVLHYRPNGLFRYSA